MASSYFELRKKQGNVMDSLREKFTQANGSNNSNRNNNINIVDDTFYTTDHIRGKEGTGHAIIRFLPEAPNPECEGGVEPTPFIKYQEWYFTGPTGRKYWNLSPLSIPNHLREEDVEYRDPASEYNYSIYRDESLSKEQKKKKYLNRREHYVSNILVIKDPNRPENEGKVFRFRYGYGIFKFIEEAMFPDQELYPDREPIPVFDMVEGADFVLRVISKTVPQENGSSRSLPSYEKSEFKSASPLFDEDEKYDKLWKRQYTLQEFLSPDRFKSYDDLLKDFVRVMGHTPDGVKPMSEDSFDRAESPSSNRSYQNVSSPNRNLSEEIDDDIPDFSSKASSNDVSDDFDFDAITSGSKVNEPEESPFKSDNSIDDDDWLKDLVSK